MNVSKFLMYPVATEKAINMISKSNTITYIVDTRSKKSDIKKEFEDIFKVKIEKIGIMRSPQNYKKAFIKLDKAYKASDIALKLKLV